MCMSVCVCTCGHTSGLGFLEGVRVVMWVNIKMFKLTGKRYDKMYGTSIYVCGEERYMCL